jgi:hypothetical protein
MFKWPNLRQVGACSLLQLLLSGQSLPILAQSKVLGESFSRAELGRNLKEIKLTDEVSRPRRLSGLSMVDFFPTVNLNFVAPVPLSLSGLRIDGLGERAKQSLSYNHFIFMPFAEFTDAAKLYAAQREAGRANFVTADAFVHAYFAQVNALNLKVIDTYLYERLEAFLSALITTQIKDYRQSEFPEVQDDIQRNLAYAVVALKLLKPEVKLPDLGGAQDLANLELGLIEKGVVSRSVIFNRLEDFSFYKPFGFYCSNVKAQRFYRAYTFLSRMNFQFSDQTNNTESGGGNAFRRAVLLYRALELGAVKRVSGENVSLMVLWQEIFKIVNALSQNQITDAATLYPQDMQGLFQKQSLDLGNLLNTLAQPMSRARLLLALRRLRPQGLNSTSIFQVNNKARPEEPGLVALRLFPLILPIEVDWLKQLTNNYQEESSEVPFSPLSLFLLYAYGSGQASNIFAPHCEALAQRLAGEVKLLEQVPTLVQLVGPKKVESDPASLVNARDKRWALISEYFRPYTREAQSFLLSEAWANQRLVSASACFLDSFCAVAMNTKPAASTSSTVSASPVEAGSGLSTIKPRPASFHYLEPCPELYGKLGAFLRQIETDLTGLGAFPSDVAEHQRFADFERLCQRLVKICDSELTGQGLSVADFKLLGNIDQILNAIDSDWTGSAHLAGAKQGANLVMAGPGLVYAIFHTNKGPFLARGALYNYFELQGNALGKEHILRKRNYGFLRLPSWGSRNAFAAEVVSR